jgi:hypothetical protein
MKNRDLPSDVYVNTAAHLAGSILQNFMTRPYTAVMVIIMSTSASHISFGEDKAGCVFHNPPTNAGSSCLYHVQALCSVALYGAETWTLLEVDQKYLKTF